VNSWVKRRQALTIYLRRHHHAQTSPGPGARSSRSATTTGGSVSVHQAPRRTATSAGRDRDSHRRRRRQHVSVSNADLEMARRGSRFSATPPNVASGTYTFTNVDQSTPPRASNNHAFIVDGDQGTPNETTRVTANESDLSNNVDITNPGGQGPPAFKALGRPARHHVQSNKSEAPSSATNGEAVAASARRQ